MHLQTRHIAGRTLIELLAILTITMLLTSQAYQGLSGFFARQTSTSQINWLIGAIHFARHAAIVHRTTITLCPGTAQSRACEGDWQNGLIAFSDRNKDAMINGDDRIINHIAAIQAHGTFTWRSFQKRKYLQMTEQGHTNYQNGNFVYCPRNQKLAAPRQIIVNVQGRVRINRRRNAAGMVVDTRGRPLRC